MGHLEPQGLGSPNPQAASPGRTVLSTELYGDEQDPDAGTSVMSRGSAMGPKAGRRRCVVYNVLSI